MPLNCLFQYGPVFSFTMVGKTFTYLIGSDAAAVFFNSKNEELNAEEVYSKLTTPVFGKGVAYDCPNAVCSVFIVCLEIKCSIYCSCILSLSSKYGHCCAAISRTEENIQDRSEHQPFSQSHSDDSG